ncbi:MAG: hypothetical protein II839_00315, partial [Kiritimatiellae bacterium]|nr:hypothetical protein [Kiritimatiellia bacterium]
AESAGAGGAGGGGRGSILRNTANIAAKHRTERIEADGQNGADGLGGGGGGADASNYSGKGGDGLVALRFTPAVLSDAPTVRATWGEPSPVSVPVTVNLVDPGDAPDADVAAVWGYDAASLTDGACALASDFAGAADFTVAGLSPGRTYHLAIAADNGNAAANAATSAVTAVTTAPMFSQPLAFAAAGSTLTYVVDGASDGDAQRLELWVGPDESSMTNQTAWTDAALLAAGSHTVAPFAAEQLGGAVAVRLRHVAVVGARAFTNDTAVLSLTLEDPGTYTWKSTVADGRWCDAANWTASAVGGRGWPTAGSTAKFPKMSVTCRVDRAVSPASATFASGGDYVFLGTSEDAALSFRGSGDQCLVDGSYRFDALAVSVTAGQNGWLGNNQKIVVTNGASLASSKNLCLRAAGGSFELGEGCSFQGTGLGGCGGATFAIDGGTATVSGNVNLSERGSATTPPVSLVLRGASSRLLVGGGFYSQHTNATVTLELARERYSAEDALIRETGTTKMAASGATLTFEAPQTEGSKKLDGCEILVADWSKSSIDATRIEFGEVDRPGSYFYFTEGASPLPKTVRRKSAEEVEDAGETARYLWYHHAPNEATVLILR